MYLYQMIKNFLILSDRLLYLEIKFIFIVFQSLDILVEKINFEMVDNIDIIFFVLRVLDESVRYYVFIYKYTYEGDYIESIGEYLVIS